MAVDTTTDQYYYENPSEWGKNQYVTLKNIIDNILIGSSDDSYFKHVPRFRARLFGKLGIKKMNVDVKVQNKAIGIQLPPTKIFPFPRYMTNWIRVSVIKECGKLEILNINNNATVQDYLQDNQWELLYDELGEVLRAEDFDADYGHCCLKIGACCDGGDPNDECKCETDKYKDSWVKANQKGSYFEFSDDLVDAMIVFEFKNAGLEGLDDCDILVHHDLELTITRYIQWNLLMGQKNIPKSEYITYKDEYKIEKKRSEVLLGNKITINQILKSVSIRYNG
tara:strand:+ start:3949 stop:4791 length:843 start_codon:yes stop_codon:yes gene_type:complete